MVGMILGEGYNIHEVIRDQYHTFLGGVREINKFNVYISVYLSS